MGKQYKKSSNERAKNEGNPPFLGKTSAEFSLVIAQNLTTDLTKFRAAFTSHLCSEFRLWQVRMRVSVS